jgi:hypothetical protein
MALVHTPLTCLKDCLQERSKDHQRDSSLVLLVSFFFFVLLRYAEGTVVCQNKERVWGTFSKHPMHKLFNMLNPDSTKNLLKAR